MPRVYTYRSRIRFSSRWSNLIPKRRLCLRSAPRSGQVARTKTSVETETVVVTIDLDRDGNILGLELIGVGDFTVQADSCKRRKASGTCGTGGENPGTDKIPGGSLCALGVPVKQKPHFQEGLNGPAAPLLRAFAS